MYGEKDGPIKHNKNIKHKKRRLMTVSLCCSRRRYVCFQREGGTPFCFFIPNTPYFSLTRGSTAA
ncbi:hypothetical protein MUS_0908 [Bacillus velezensis YAU B9601-Y2]|uniref:Uncharacterized protein n=1 Tax=Bacillus amyloliquefaciens (strain Y2) TaxID=1155777 RepID=I2C2S7_BACAY|nr:hypothetical protein MUS_0908 [Bacillus velezensis YAU B9601-Y2]